MGSNLGEHKGAHVLAVPYYTHGHITPMLGFTTELARKGVTISFVCFEEAVPCATSDKMSELRTLDFRFITTPYPTLPNNVELTYLPRTDRENKFKEAVAPVLEKFGSEKNAASSPTCIISDMFLYWTLVSINLSFGFMSDELLK
jgi:hypothetical protein